MATMTDAERFEQVLHNLLALRDNAQTAEDHAKWQALVDHAKHVRKETAATQPKGRAPRLLPVAEAAPVLQGRAPRKMPTPVAPAAAPVILPERAPTLVDVLGAIGAITRKRAVGIVGPKRS